MTINNFQQFQSKVDLTSREKIILDTIAEKTDFVAQKCIWRSDYYGTGQVGAVHYLGQYQKQKAVLKIQAAKPDISECQMINSFAKQNKSEIIRPPLIYAKIDWNERLHFEALIMEYISGDKILDNHSLHKKQDIQKFFTLYHEYKTKCVTRPWIKLTDEKKVYLQKINQARQLMQKIKPDSDLRHAEDIKLAKKAQIVLEKVWSIADWEFMHGHFSVHDLIKQNKQWVLLSNLFWKWKHPFYDLVFAYHWLMISQASVTDFKPEQLDEQRNLWLQQIKEQINKSDEQQIRLLHAALLERALAALLVDGLAYLDDNLSNTQYLISVSRKRVKQLINDLK